VAFWELLLSRPLQKNKSPQKHQISLFAKLMSAPNRKFFPEILKSGYPLNFFGLFHRANSYDHRPEIKFQRISAKKFGFFSVWCGHQFCKE